MKLTSIDESVLRAAVDRIIPRDDFPSAWEAGVGDYIARQLEGDLAALAESFAAGLAALDAEALLLHGRPFAASSESEQDDVLRRVEAGDVLGSWLVPPENFFALLVNATAEGYYSDPGNGGNRGAVSWAMVGFEESTDA
jgi:hypothetical protein